MAINWAEIADQNAKAADVLETKLQAANATIEVLREAMLRLGKHGPDCGYGAPSDGYGHAAESDAPLPCSCEIAQALDPDTLSAEVAARKQRDEDAAKWRALGGLAVTTPIEQAWAAMAAVERVKARIAELEAWPGDRVVDKWALAINNAQIASTPDAHEQKENE